MRGTLRTGVSPIFPGGPRRLVVGGVAAPPNLAPFIVALLYQGDASEVLCGGAILSRNVIVTAAHCFARSDGNSYAWLGFGLDEEETVANLVVRYGCPGGDLSSNNCKTARCVWRACARAPVCALQWLEHAVVVRRIEKGRLRTRRQ